MLQLDQYHDDAYLRQAQLVKPANKRKCKWDLEPPLLPFSGPTLWRKVKEGTFPKPVKFSSRVTAWRVGDVREWLKAKRTA